jgi:hypothetical protein
MSIRGQTMDFSKAVVLDAFGPELPELIARNLYIEPCDLNMLSDLHIFTKNLQKGNVSYIMAKFVMVDDSLVVAKGSPLPRKNMVAIFWTPPNKDPDLKPQKSGREGDIDFFATYDVGDVTRDIEWNKKHTYKQKQFKNTNKNKQGAKK